MVQGSTGSWETVFIVAACADLIVALLAVAVLVPMRAARLRAMAESGATGEDLATVRQRPA